MLRLFLSLIIWANFSVFCYAQNNKIEMAELNSPSVEYAPSVSADGNVILFQSNRSGKYELYESNKQQNGTWSTPTKLTGAINDYGTDQDLIGGPSITYDGNRIYFFASYDDGYGAEDIYYSDRVKDGWSTPINVGNKINSKNYEGFPNISSDGKSLYFMRLNQNIVNNLNCYTMMVSHKDTQGDWQEPTALPSPLNEGCEKFPRIMPDNNTLIFSSIRESSINNTFDLYETELNDTKKWTNPKPLTFANTDNHDYFSAVSSEFDKLYTNIRGKSDYDIYSYDIPLDFKPQHKIVNIQGVVRSKNGTPLPSTLRVIQKEKQEEIISIENNASNGRYTIVLGEGTYQLICESDGFSTFREDINLPEIEEYELIKKDITLEPFTQTINLKAYNNRDRSEITPTWNITSANGSHEVKNSSFIAQQDTAYKIEAQYEGYSSALKEFSIVNMDTTEATINIPLMPKKPELRILPRDSETKETLEVSLMVRNLTTKKTIYKNKLSEDSTLTLDFNSKFRVYAIAKNHLFVQDIVDMSAQSVYNYVEYPLELQPIEPGAKLTLKEIYFEFGSAELDESSNEELQAVFNFLKFNKSIVVEISAHTDNVGSFGDNQELSEQRAQSVVDYLKSKGVPATMLEGKGYGEKEPIVSNLTKDGRSQNRRVEFKILKTRNS